MHPFNYLHLMNEKKKVIIKVQEQNRTKNTNVSHACNSTISYCILMPYLPYICKGIMCTIQTYTFVFVGGLFLLLYICAWYPFVRSPFHIIFDTIQMCDTRNGTRISVHTHTYTHTHKHIHGHCTETCFRLSISVQSEYRTHTHCLIAMFVSVGLSPFYANKLEQNILWCGPCDKQALTTSRRCCCYCCGCCCCCCCLLTLITAVTSAATNETEKRNMI